MKNKTNPIRKKEEIRQNPDRKTNQDFSGHPDGPDKGETIKSETIRQVEGADADNKEGEKPTYKKNETDEQDSDGSANAFEYK